MSNVTLREFHYPDDLSVARNLWENAGSGVHLGQSDEPQEITKKLLRDPDLFLVAVAEGRIIGTVIGGFDGRRGMIYHLAVDAGFRSQGVGGLLMDEVEKRLKRKGCLRCYLLVTTENENAMQFYRARGWQRMENIYPYAKDLGEG